MPNFIRGIAHTAYVVSDMKAALEFYEGALGFEKAFELSDDRGNPWIVYLGVGDDQFIELFYSAPGSEKAKGQIGANHLCLLTDNIEEAARHLRDGGYPLDAEISRGKDGNLQCWTHDPDGNRIEIMQLGEDSLQMKFIKSKKS
ncbi:MAG: VOC family protein [Clostridiales bacterium]|jgi:glyoxylase I family protein|nr:VOC family protein [Clostridiales bacterium]